MSPAPLASGNGAAGAATPGNGGGGITYLTPVEQNVRLAATRAERIPEGVKDSEILVDRMKRLSVQIGKREEQLSHDLLCNMPLGVVACCL